MGIATVKTPNEGQEVREGFEAFFSQRTRDGLRVILPLIGALHAFVAAVYWFTAPYEQALGLSSLSIMVTVAAAAAAALVARREHRIIGADGLATCVILLALCNALIHLAASWSPLAVAAAAILLVAAGLTSSRRSPLLIIPAAMHGWWALLAWADNWSGAWMQFETALIGATVIAWGLYFSRRKASMQLFESEQRFAAQSQRDPLTNLPIRPAVVDRLGECFSRSARNADRTFGLCVLNLDGFRKVNEVYGHTKGDLLLQTVGERLRLACRRSDMVARLGGDEFVILLDEIPSRDHAEAGADRLCDLSCAPVDLDGVTLEISVSHGVVWSGAGYESEEAMLAAAHKQMQAAKARYHAIAGAVEARKQSRPARQAAVPSLA